MRVLITGGAGFIGSNLALAAEKIQPTWEIVVLDNLFSGNNRNLSGFKGKQVEGDIRDRKLLESLLPSFDAVVHLAAVGSVPRSIADPEFTFSNNVGGTSTLLEAMRSANVSRLIFASSSSVYGSNPRNPRTETDYLAPMSPYAASKVAGEALVQSYANAFDFKVNIFRFFNVYGPRQNPEGQYAAVIPRFLKAAAAGHPLKIFGNGHQTRDFTFVDTVTASLLSALAENRYLPNPVNLALGTETTITSLAVSIQALANKKSDIHYAERRPGDVEQSRANSEIFQKEFPNARNRPLSEGLRITFEWMNEIEQK